LRAQKLVQAKDTTAAVGQSFDAADSLYAQAHTADPSWTEPMVGRAWVAYRRSRLVGLDGAAAKPWIEKGEKFADEALAVAPQDPDGLEARGSLRYWSWLLNLEPDPAAAKRLLAMAEADLEAAVRVRPAQAGAWAMLSHLYNNTKGTTDAKLAGQRAYEADAYLSNADQVLNRLFLASYDLSQFTDATHWCEEGARRFPEDFKFTKCQLWLMTTKAKDPDVPAAWKLADSIPLIVPAGRRDIEGREARMLVAMVLARAGLKDSARHVAEKARGGPDIDPTQSLAWDEIYVRILVGDKEAALKALKSYLAANPKVRANLAEQPNWWFRSIEDDPQYKALVGIS
jgi:eukaryotic-like serine/threonine-protein kinase